MVAEPTTPGQLLEPPKTVEVGVQTNEVLGSKAALEFAQRTFSSSQELIRFMDQKASYALGATAALVAALALAINTVDAPVSGLGFFLFLSGCTSAVALSVFVCKALLAALDVYRARGKEASGDTKQAGLLFPLHIRNLSGDDPKKFVSALTGATESLIVAEYAAQIVALAAIYEAKQNAVNRLVETFHYVAAAWLAALLFLAASAVLH